MANDPWAGLREPTPGAFARPQFKNPNPFNALFAPDRPGLFGLIGSAMGNPTRQESLLSGAGQASGAGLKAIQERIAAGMPPQKAILDVLGSPEGVDWFTTPGADPLGDITNFMKMTQPPAPQDLINMSPGSTIYDPNSREPLYTNQTEALQTFNGFAALSDLPEVDIADLAAANLRRMTGGDTTATERAAGRLLERGVIDQDTHDLLLSGAISVEPVLDPYGSPTGRFTIVDKTGARPPQMVGADTMQNGPQPELETPGAPGAKPQPLATVPTDEKAVQAAPPGSILSTLEDPADIIRGGGWFAGLQRGAGNVAGDILPGLVAEDQNKYKAALEKIRIDARELRAGSRLAGDIAIIDDFVNSVGVSDTPLKVGQQLIAWQDFLDSREERAVLTMSDKTTSKEERKAAAADLNSIRTARANIPTREALAAKMDQIRQEPGPAISGLGKLPGVVLDAVRQLGKDAGGAEAEAEKAIEAGGTPEASGAPAVGTVVDGYRFKGGNPNDPNSWEQVK